MAEQLLFTIGLGGGTISCDFIGKESAAYNWLAPPTANALLILEEQVAALQAEVAELSSRWRISKSSLSKPKSHR
jgi:hypothetical protein